MERQLNTAEALNNELGKWERAKLAAASIALIGLAALTSELVIGLKTHSEQVLAAMGWAMMGTGALIVFCEVLTINFSRKGDRTIKLAHRLGIETTDRFFRRRLITQEQQAS